VHIGLVTPAYGGSWSEAQLVARRLAGALACGAEVDVLVPRGSVSTDTLDGALRVRHFSATGVDPARRAAWRQVALGPTLPHDPFVCTCRSNKARAEPLPAMIEEEFLLAEGGHSPELFQHLRQTAYDLVIFVGLHTPATYWGAQAIPEGGRMILVPATTDESVIWLGLHGKTLERVERVVVSTEHERLMWADRLGADDRIENINFLVGVNPLARLTDPHDFDRQNYLIVADDWTRPVEGLLTRLAHWAELIERDVHPAVRLRVVGPGADHHPLGIRLTSSRLDIWRWMARSIAVLDPQPQRLVGRQVLEAFLYQVPVIVHFRGGASREHAEAGNGGLWFRTDDEFCATVQALLDPELRQALGEQGCSYAQHRYADTDSFIKGVAKVFLS
jgi:glycosyltransferase involved in cell wall biosynthesis